MKSQKVISGTSSNSWEKFSTQTKRVESCEYPVPDSRSCPLGTAIHIQTNPNRIQTHRVYQDIGGRVWCHWLQPKIGKLRLLTIR